MRSRGITLFELLIVLVVIGIVAAMALPGYRRQLSRVHRTEAMTSLLKLQSAEESFYQRHAAYSGNLTSAPPAGLGVSAETMSGNYMLSVAVAADGQSFVATAMPAPSGGQAADGECMAFSIDAQGRRTVTGTRDAKHCWK